MTLEYKLVVKKISARAISAFVVLTSIPQQGLPFAKFKYDVPYTSPFCIKLNKLFAEILDDVLFVKLIFVEHAISL